MVDLDGIHLDPVTIARLARAEDSPHLTDAARHRIVDSYQWALRASAERPVYGRSTGVGANRQLTVEDEDAHSHALALLRSHATSAGPRRSPERVRAMLVVRLNQLAAGGSGSTPGLADALEAMLIADALPLEVREYASVGTGDLAALAAVGLALQGESPTAAPLPGTWRFGRHDVLPFLSSNAGVIGDAALALADLTMLGRAYLVTAALTFIAVRGNPEAFAPVVERATPFRGAIECCRVLRSLTAGGPEPRRIQDPFGLRAIPQAHGAYLDSLDRLADVVTGMANAPAENPVLAPGETDEIAHHGSFHASYLALAADSAAIGLAGSAQLVAARLAALIDPVLTGGVAFLADGTPGRSGVMAVEYVAASALARIRAATTPASVQTAVLSRGVEEDASFASLAATSLLGVVEPLRILLACELLCAQRAVRLAGLDPASPVLARALEICAVLPADAGDRDLTDELSAAAGLLPELAALIAR